MSPSELEQYLEMPNMPNLRLTLASGDQVIVKREDIPFVSGLALILKGDRENQAVTRDSRLISIPNIVLAETVETRPTSGERRRRFR
jgi:hypothetical protein